jgi:hypothetical protein
MECRKRDAGRTAAERQRAIREYMADWWEGKADPVALAQHLTRHLGAIGRRPVDRLRLREAEARARGRSAE